MDSKLLETIESPEFDCFQCLYELSKYGHNIGVHHLLAKKLYSFPYSELEFFIPQIIQILISFESESMALHDLILHFSRESPHFCLLTFWNLQAYVFELKNQPDSYSFHIVRSFINSLQAIMFNQDKNESELEMLRENLHPALVLAGAVGASLGLSNIHDYIKPIIISQGKQQKSFLFKLANFHSALTKNLTLKNRGQPMDLGSHGKDSSEDTDVDIKLNSQRYSESVLATHRCSPRESSSFTIESDVDLHYNSDYSQDHKSPQGKILHPKRLSKKITQSSLIAQTNTTPNKIVFTSQSMPELVRETASTAMLTNTSAATSSFVSLNLVRSLSAEYENQKKEYTSKRNSWALKANYFRKETEFMMVLQNISSRLSQVPKEARLTSLRAELSIINSALLPSQIDIPQLFPSSSSPNKRYHRILKLNINEACVLNSAERVPFLLLIEFLSEDMDFDPNSESNLRILSNDGQLDLLTKSKGVLDPTSYKKDEVIEPAIETDLADISVVALSNKHSHFSNHLRANMSDSLIRDTETDSKCFPLSQEYHKTTGEESNGSSKRKTIDLSAQIRIAAVMLNQLEKSGQANSDQSAAIKTRIIKSMEALQDQFDTIDYQQIKEISAVHEGTSGQDAGDRKIENDFKIGEDWATKRARIRRMSQYGHLPHWDLCSVIVKNGDDLQQEALACQLISVISHVWKKDNVGVWTKSMKIVVISFNSGLVETINNALSVHSIKKTMTELSIKSGENPRGVVASIKDYFLRVYGPENGARYKRAQECFAKSLAAYSIICYVLQIKDRHNGNIMLDNDGHIIHIDFGFILSNSPGSVGFEAAPFKLSMEYVDVLGGLQSTFFQMFTNLCKKCFLSLRKHCETLVNLVDLMQKDSSLPCFKNGPQTSVLLKQRLQLELSDDECNNFVETTLIGKSVGSVYTRLYDQFQLLTQGIYS